MDLICLKISGHWDNYESNSFYFCFDMVTRTIYVSTKSWQIQTEECHDCLVWNYSGTHWWNDEKYSFWDVSWYITEYIMPDAYEFLHQYKNGTTTRELQRHWVKLCEDMFEKITPLDEEDDGDDDE